MNHEALWSFVVRSRIRGALRGQPADSAAAARGALANLDLAWYGRLRTEADFSDELDAATEHTRAALPSGSWGWARKCVNMVLRDAVYNVYLREHFGLGILELWAEIPLDNEVAAFLRSHEPDLPAGFTVAGVRPDTHRRFQRAAAMVAARHGIPRLHLDVLIWGSPERRS